MAGEDDEVVDAVWQSNNSYYDVAHALALRAFPRYVRRGTACQIRSRLVTGGARPAATVLRVILGTRRRTG